MTSLQVLRTLRGWLTLRGLCRRCARTGWRGACHATRCCGVFHIIGRGFLLVCPFGSGVLLIIELGLDPGFLTVFVPAVHACYTPGSRAKHGVVGQMPANRARRAVFKAATRLGLYNSGSNCCGHNARQPQSYHAVQCHTLSLFPSRTRPILRGRAVLHNPIWWQDYGF